MKKIFELIKEKAKSLCKFVLGVIASKTFDELAKPAFVIGSSLAVAIITLKRMLKDTSLRKNKPTDAYSQSIDFPREVENDMSFINPIMRRPVEAMLGKSVVAKNFDKNRRPIGYGYGRPNKYLAMVGKDDFGKKHGKKHRNYDDLVVSNDYFLDMANDYDFETPEEKRERRAIRERKERARRQEERRLRAAEESRRQPQRNEKPLTQEVAEIFANVGLQF